MRLRPYPSGSLDESEPRVLLDGGPEMAPIPPSARRAPAKPWRSSMTVCYRVRLGWGPRNGPHTPQRSSRPGKAVALLDDGVLPRPPWMGAPKWPPYPQRFIAGSPRPSNGLRLRTPARPGNAVALLDDALKNEMAPCLDTRQRRRGNPSAPSSARTRRKGTAADVPRACAHARGCGDGELRAHCARCEHAVGAGFVRIAARPATSRGSADHFGSAHDTRMRLRAIQA